MGRIFKIKPRINKANGQVNFSLPKKKMPLSLKKMINSDSMPILKFKFEGVE